MLSTSSLIISFQVLITLVTMTFLLGVTKALRGKRGALSASLNLNDILVLMLVSCLWIICLTGLHPVWSGVLSFCIGLYGCLIWLDALLFIQYRIEINRQTLAWCFTGAKGLKKGLPHLFSGLKKLPSATLVVPLWLLLIVVNANGWMQAWVTSALPHTVLSIGFSIFALGLTLCLLALIIRTRVQPEHAFFSAPTLLLNIFADDTFDVSPDVAIASAHEHFIQPLTERPTPSSQFGALTGANIILITVESLGAYVTPYAQNAARSRIAERLKNNSWLSEKHFCLCPNTTVSTNQMYTGGYSNNPYNKDDSLFPGTEPKHIELLKSNGYKTLFLDSADIQLYDYHKLLKRIGFDKVWGTTDMPANGLQGDYRLLNMVEEVANTVGSSPFYLHIINDQSHMPYEVVDKQRFNRHGFADNKSVYLNAIEEVDYIIDTFLERLGEQVDLSNTAIVFTGDHGESFGEYGYSFHSNSVINAQVQVPFMLHHPKLSAKTIEHSCHFDLFPTFFDLLGIDCPYPTLGKSLAFDNRDFAYFFHSATLKGNSPANFGFMLDGDMIWMDRLFNQVNHIHNGQQRQKVSTDQKRYSKTLLHMMLKSRGVLA